MKAKISKLKTKYYKNKISGKPEKFKNNLKIKLRKNNNG